MRGVASRIIVDARPEAPSVKSAGSVDSKILLGTRASRAVSARTIPLDVADADASP